VSDAEVLVPGFRVPTFDAAQTRKVTMDGMCAMRRNVLDHMLSTHEGRSLLGTVSNEPNLQLQGKTCDAVATLFKAAAGAKRVLNNNAATKDAGNVPAQVSDSPVVGRIKTPADLNRFYAQYHAAKK
jgi:hypothetical protein